jgi:3-phenylpropionate/trans-cinnamate dioxygenase ferredoxin component
MYKKIAKINELQEGKILTKETRYNRIGLTKIGSSFYAFEDTCSHDGEQISEGEILDGCVVCPRHLAKFELKTGKPTCMPATEPIPVYNVRVVGEDVEVELED